MSISFNNKPSFEVVGMGLTSDKDGPQGWIDAHPVIQIVDAIYDGYRQCYMAGTPTTLDPEKHFVTEANNVPQEKIDDLRKRFYEHMDALGFKDGCRRTKRWDDAIGSAMCPDTLESFLYKCDFISKHLNHESQLEHGVITLSIKNISRCACMQLVRHRIASYGMQSQRYVEWDKDGKGAITVPSSIARSKEASAVFHDAVEHIEEAIAQLKKLGIPNEDIRYLYPEGTNSNIIVTMNLRSWIHFIEERMCSKAQWEIRSIAKDLRDVFVLMFPFIFSENGVPKLGPKCMRLGKCPEAKSCGYIDALVGNK